MKYSINAYSDIGGRNKNEDSYIICSSSEGILAVVADGLGGYDDGELASSMLVNSLKEEYARKPDFDISKAISIINDQIIDLQKNRKSKMKTTVAVVRISSEYTLFAHVGDTRIYAFKDGKICFQSKDHSVSQMSVQVGEIAADQIRNHPDRNMLTRAIGGAETIKVEIEKVFNDFFDAILICSDGFWEYILESEMCSALQNVTKADQWLTIMKDILSYRVSDKNDNNTAIMIMKRGV